MDEDFVSSESLILRKTPLHQILHLKGRCKHQSRQVLRWRFVPALLHGSKSPLPQCIEGGHQTVTGMNQSPRQPSVGLAMWGVAHIRLAD